MSSNTTVSTTSTNIVKHLVSELSENLNVNGEEFIKEDFDLKSFTTAIIKTNQLSEHLGRLAQNLHIIDKEIREQVSEHHEDLLHQAVNIETLEDMLDMVQTRISSLKSTSERLRIKITQPYNELNLRILQLSRLQSACDTLRRIKGVLHHSARLRTHMQAGVRDLVKSAQCLNELEFLLRDFDASGIEIIEQDVLFAHKSRHEVEEQAQLMLDKSLIHQDQTQIGTALQVFYSLGILTQKLNQTLKTNEKNFQKLSNDLLDTTNLTLLSTTSLSSTQSSAVLSTSTQFPGRVNMPNVGSMSQFRAQLWSNVEKLMDLMFDSCTQIVQLQQILEKKKDLLTNLFYVDEIDFSTIYKGKMYFSDLNKLDDDLNTNSKVIVYDGLCACIDINEINAKKSIEFLYEQWRLLSSVLNTSILNACTQSNYIKQTFQTEYPKLLKLQNDLWLRLLQLNPLIDRYRYLLTDKSNTKQKLIYQSSYELLRKCFVDLENAYLNRSLSHLFDPINLIFSQSGSDKQINRNDIETFIKGIQAQLQTIQYDTFNVKQMNQLTTFTSQSGAFSDKVIANVCKSIQMYANKSEQVLNSLNVEMQQMISSAKPNETNNIFAFTSVMPNQIQTKNLDYVNVTHDLYEQLTRMFENEKLNKKLNEKLITALKTLLTFEENAIAPYIQSASDCILAIMLTMHQEDFNQQASTCSLYVKELQQVLQRICRDYLQSYQCKHILTPYLNQLAVRCIDLFIRHASILRPVSESTRRRLLADSQQIETIIQGILCPKLTDLGVSYKQLKAFRHLLTIKSPLEVETPSSLGDDVVDETHYAVIISESLPYSILLHYLFSYASTDFKSPHQSLDWSVGRYSEWLDKHTSEKERLMVVRTCLEAYVNLVKQKNLTKFATIYPLMVRLLEKSLN